MEVFAPLHPLRLKRLKHYIGKMDNLIAYYPMQEHDGTVSKNYAPDNYNQMNGNISGATIFQPAKVGKGYSFDGVNDSITIADDSRLEGVAAVTMSFLIRADDTSVYRKVVSKADVYDVGINDLGEIFAEFIGVHNFGTLGSTPTIDDGVWRHICLTYNGSTAVAYINGTAVETASGLSGSIATSSGILILGNNGGTEWHLGMLQHFALLGRALSAAEVLRISKIAGVV